MGAAPGDTLIREAALRCEIIADIENIEVRDFENFYKQEEKNDEPATDA